MFSFFLSLSRHIIKIAKQMSSNVDVEINVFVKDQKKKKKMLTIKTSEKESIIFECILVFFDERIM